MKANIKRIYRKVPFKQEIYTVLKKIIKPSESIYKHLHFEGVFEVEIDDNHFFKMKHYGFQIENDVFWKGVYDGWEKVSLQLWGELCSKSEHVMDIGANTGIYSLVTKALNSQAIVFAFEPIERVYERLNYNMILNDYDVICVKKALSNFDGKALVYDKNTPHTYSVTVNKDTSVDKETSVAVEIETVRLDTFIEIEGIEQIDLMKIDVETHEPEVLEGMGEYLKKFQPTFLIEVLNNDVAMKIMTLIDGMDYVFYNIDENGKIRKVRELTKSDYYNFLVCKPDIASGLKTLKTYITN